MKEKVCYMISLDCNWYRKEKLWCPLKFLKRVRWENQSGITFLSPFKSKKIVIRFCRIASVIQIHGLFLMSLAKEKNKQKKYGREYIVGGKEKCTRAHFGGCILYNRKKKWSKTYNPPAMRQIRDPKLQIQKFRKKKESNRINAEWNYRNCRFHDRYRCNESKRVAKST